MAKPPPTGTKSGPLTSFNGAAVVQVLQDTDVVAEHIAGMPEEQVMLTIAAQATVSLKEAYQHLTPLQVRFLHTRALVFTDVEGRHLMGKHRPEGNTRVCGCSRRLPGWNDLREQTVLNWKKQEHFMVAYTMLLAEPLLFAASRLESLVPNAVSFYAGLIGDANAKDADRLRARMVPTGRTRRPRTRWPWSWPVTGCSGAWT